MKPYQTYKDSGQLWLGDIPKHWTVLPVKHFLDINQQILPENTPADYAIEYLDISNVGSTGIIGSPERLAFDNAPSRARRVVKSGDTLISTVRTYLKAIAHIDTCSDNLVASTGFAVLTPRKNVLPKYISYLIYGHAFINQVTAESKGVNYPAITSVELGNIKMATTANLLEQAAIVAYLDRKTADIERFIAKKRQLITLLNEQKTAIINRAVTKGLNPGVPMKASGVEWLGEVPAHWEIKHLKYLFSEVDRRTTTGEEGLLSLRLRQGLIDDPKLAAGLIQPKDLIGYKITEPGEVVMNRMQASNGLFGLTPRYGLVSPDYAVFKTGCDVVPSYFIRLFNMNQMRTKFRQESKGLGDGSSGFLRLYSDRFGVISSAVPPTDEQASIVAYIDAENAVVNTVISRIEREIELIQEYQTTLISDAVTGRIDVREVTDAKNAAANLTT